ncbi:G-protein coupled receptor Mth2-like isoform X2 [Epargyreus clarus]
MNLDQYCVDYILKKNGNLKDTFIFLYYNPPPATNLLLVVGLYISSGFLFLVLVVYSLLPSLRNLTGLLLMAYVFSQLLTFLFVAFMQEPHTHGTCVRLLVTMYFFNFASFCWMNIMAFDIWWTFRGYAKARPIHRRGETFKFLIYCVYGFGLPLAMTIGFVVIHNTPMDHIPGFLKPLGKYECFFKGLRKHLYLDLPMAILIACNWMFFLMTAFNIWRLHRATAMLDSTAAATPTAHRNQRQRLCIYLKLSFIMGISWILEVVASLVQKDTFQSISDAYNLFSGPVIFIIFVCNKNVFSLLKTRYQQLFGCRLQRTSTNKQSNCTISSDSKSNKISLSTPEYKKCGDPSP